MYTCKIFNCVEFESLNMYFYYINCSYSLGFRPRRKTISPRVQNYDNFVRVYDITNHLLTRHLLYFAPLFRIDEWMATRSLFSMLGFTKRPVEIIDVSDVLKFPEAEKNKARQRKTHTDLAFVMTFRVNCGEQKQKQLTLAVLCF